jgi:hypothetical protein
MRSTQEAWLQAYQRHYAALPDGPFGNCPECGSGGLELVISAASGQHRGIAYFWCPTCLVGLVLTGARSPKESRSCRLNSVRRDASRGFPTSR